MTLSEYREQVLEANNASVRVEFGELPRGRDVLRGAKLGDRAESTWRWWQPVWQRREASAGYGEWLATWRRWDWMITVTFREEIQERSRTVGEVCEWMDQGTSLSCERVTWALAEEWGGWNGRYHMHAVAAGVRGLSHRFMWSEGFRRFGRTRIETVRDAAGAAAYVAKYICKQDGGIWFGGAGALEPQPVVGGNMLTARFCGLTSI